MPNQLTSDDGAHQSGQSGGRIFGLSGLLIELVLPVALSSALLLVMASYTSYWDLRSPLGLGIFGLLLVALSVFTSLRLDAFTLERRRRSGRRRLLNRANSRARLVKFILGGLVIPIAALSAANLFELPNHQTPMALASVAVRSRLAKSEVSRAARLGDAVLRARSPAAKVQGILALQAMASVEAMDQLFRILSDDPTALNNASEYQALSAALASYGVQAEMRLVQLFNGVPPLARRSAPAPPDDPLEQETADRSPLAAAPATELEHPSAARVEPKPTSNPIETGPRPVQGAGSLPSFVMQTFLQMGFRENADLLAFARQTAADEGWSDAVRGRALQLTAKLGGKDDLDGLFAYLESPSVVLQAHAMRAIATLQSKLAAATTKG